MGKYPVSVKYADGSTKMVKSGHFQKQKRKKLKKQKRTRKNIRKIKSEKVFERDGNKCVLCGRTSELLAKIDQYLCCHHLNYDRYGDEDLDDLISTCVVCHDNEHKWLKRGITTIPRQVFVDRGQINSPYYARHLKNPL